MAPRKGKESLLELCHRTTLLGNSISVRMLEYLSTAKKHPYAFRELATDFLDISRILWSIEAGLNEASSTKNKFPVDMVQELDAKFRQTNDDFIVLNQMLLKFLEYEKKGTFGRLQKGWRMMFSNTDIEKMRESLVKSRDALRMSSMVFRWSIGDAKADASAGIGYTGLVAALERMNQDRPTTVIPALQPTEAPELPPQLPPMSLIERHNVSNTARADGASPGRLNHQSLYRASSTVSSAPTIHSMRKNVKDNSSDDTAESHTLIDETTHENNLNFKYPSQFVRLKADPTTVPRWTPRGSYGHHVIGSRTALANAVQQKDNKTLEQLLDGGAGADGLEANILIRACLNRDAECVRLLLLFGADPNGTDKGDLTPLNSATKMSFLEGAKMLIKYGADPNLSAGPNNDSAFALAVSEHKFEFAHLYLMYGGDPNLIMENGNTTLIQAIKSNVPPKLIQLMLDYDIDPNAKNVEGKTALFEAILANRPDLMALLLDYGANPNLPGPKHPLWPSTYQPKTLQLMLSRGADATKCPGIMELAASIKSTESISILLDVGVSPNTKKDGIYTPLCSAIRDNSVEIVTLLLSRGADPNLMASEYPAFKCVTHHRAHLLPQLVAAGSNLREPKGIIEKAVAHNNKDALKYLLDQGVNPNERSDDGYTALTTAIRDNHGEFVDMLLAHGADPAIRGQDWPICMAVKRPSILRKLLPAMSNPSSIRGVMEMAVVANELESIKLLLRAGISIEDKTGGVFSPLTTAIREDKKELVRFLLNDAGADPNAPGEHLPIIKAIRRYRGDTEIIEMLLAKGADINKMYRGWNAILQAVENGDGKILKLLVEKGGGVDLQVTDENGRAVIDIVAERGWEEAVTLLLSGGGRSEAK